MDVLVFATKSCPHRAHMERWLRELDVDFRLVFVDDEPERAESFALHHSPSLVIDGELVFHGMPSSADFLERLDRVRGTSPPKPPAGVQSLDRLPERAPPRPLPEPVPGQEGLYQVDATWGTIQPMEVAEGVRTVGELEVIEHLRAERQVVDARTSDFYERGTLPGSLSIPHSEAVGRKDELDEAEPAVFFCNGPQCAQSPWAITALLEAGHPPDRILYYRGGVHDWVTLGLPTVRGRPGGSDDMTSPAEDPPR